MKRDRTASELAHRCEIEARLAYMPGWIAQCRCGWSGKRRDSLAEAQADHDAHYKARTQTAEDAKAIAAAYERFGAFGSGRR